MCRARHACSSWQDPLVVFDRPRIGMAVEIIDGCGKVAAGLEGVDLPLLVGLAQRPAGFVAHAPACLPARLPACPPAYLSACLTQVMQAAPPLPAP